MKKINHFALSVAPFEPSRSGTSMLEESLRKKYQFLTKNQKKVAESFLSWGDEVAFLSISDLARQMKTSESTIVRFARSIGYQGYRELQKELQGRIKQRISPPQALQKAISRERGKDMYSKIFAMDIGNLGWTQKGNGEKKIDRAVEAILGARKVGITGFRTSHAMAYLLSFFLGQVRKDCELLAPSPGILPNQLIHYGPQDLVIGISFPRYGAPTLDILKYAKKAGCKILSITDTPISPVGQISDLVLVAGHKSSTYFNSFSGAVTLINCLVAGVSLKSRHSVEVLKNVTQIAEGWKFLLH
jgi:DNA-binding MurR/RpiR family transcriptional regulator